MKRDVDSKGLSADLDLWVLCLVCFCIGSDRLLLSCLLRDIATFFMFESRIVPSKSLLLRSSKFSIYYHDLDNA